MPRGPRPSPLPDPHPSVPFAIRSGVATRARTNAADLDRSVWGVRARIADHRDHLEQCRLFAVRLEPTAFFSHVSAARIWSAPLPPDLRDDRWVDVSVPAPRRAPHADGLLGHAVSIEPRDIVTHRGVRVTSPGRTWRDLGRVLGVPDLVAVGDHLIHHRLPLVSQQELVDRAAATGRQPGGGRLRTAASLLCDRAESRPESLLRVILRQAGLHDFEVNREIVLHDGGAGVRADFTFPAARLIIEYQGGHHRSREQWRRDMTRRGRLEEAGWTVMEVNADDLRDPALLVARVRSRLRAATQ